jgi:hypothetical protein
MKKIVAVLVVLALFTSTVFAGPVSRASLIDTVKTVKVDTAPGFADNANLFGDVQAPALSDTEAAAVEGDGWFEAIFGGIANGLAGAFVGLANGGIVGAILGGLGGVAIGAYTGWTADAIKIDASLHL